MSMFNADQRDYMADLAAMPPATKCWCGWYPIGECPHCPPGKSAADKVAVWCPDCHNDPGPGGDRPIVHRVGCPRREAGATP